MTDQVRRSITAAWRRADGEGLARLVDLLGVAGAVLGAVYLGSALATESTGPAIAYVGVAATVVTAAIVPQAGLFLWMVLAPFRALFHIPMGSGLPDLSLTRVMTLFFVAMLAAQVAAGRRRLIRPTAVEGWGIVFILAMALYIGSSRLGWIGGIQNVFDTVAAPLLGFIFARTLFGQKRHLGWMAIALAVVGAILGLIAAREQLTNQPILSPVPWRWSYGRYSVRVTSLFGAPAIMAMTLAVPLPVVFLCAARSSRLAARLFWYGSVAAILAGLLLTYVRGGWLAGIAGVMTVVILSRRARPLGLGMLVVALLIALAANAGPWLDTRAIEERLQSEGPINYRMEALAVGADLVASSPVFGVGLDNYSDAAAAAGWQPRSSNANLSVAAHNMFLYVTTSGGVVALVPLLLLLAAIGLRGLRMVGLGRRATEEERDWGAVVLGMLIGYVAIVNTFDALAAQVANLLFFIALGAIFGTFGMAGPSGSAQQARVEGSVAAEAESGS